jgi:predicted dehydrogenase
MNVIIIGAGRMGLRHGQGLAGLKQVESICFADISEAALQQAGGQLEQTPHASKFKFVLIQKEFESEVMYDVAIVASTASNRIAICEKLIHKGVKYFLIEKPLGQNYQEVVELCEFFEKNKQVQASVNLNMRMYPFLKKLKDDFKTLAQFQGEKTFSVNTGTLGIGANGIHYLDLLYFLLDAKRAEIIAGEIEEDPIPSGRGSQFCDFGGWSLIKFYGAKENYLGKAFLSMSSNSTVFGSWDIIGSHGRVQIDEIEQTRINKYRRAESTLPVNRYAGDYQKQEIEKIESPALGDLSAEWLLGVMAGANPLPGLPETLAVHKLMFDWLAKSRKKFDKYPIT